MLTFPVTRLCYLLLLACNNIVNTKLSFWGTGEGHFGVTDARVSEVYVVFFKKRVSYVRAEINFEKICTVS